MSEACPIPSPAAARYHADLSRARSEMLGAVFAALKRAEEQVTAAYRVSGLEGEPPPAGYFAAVAHQALYCTLCGADPDTFAGGDARRALPIIRNSQEIARHYWGAEIAPSPKS